MTGITRGSATAGLIVALLLLAIAVCAWAFTGVDQRDRRRNVVLMSSIALQWGEADMQAIASGDARPDPLFTRLSETSRFVVVDSVEELQAAGVKVALLIQPKAFAPADLVRLDNWVRAGGRLLFFADPALDWPSALPLGDPGRPLFTSLHAPLFAHWGLELTLPVDAAHAQAAVEARFGENILKLKSPGAWVVAPSAAKVDADCRIARNPLLAECRVGKGQAVLVADADMLRSDLWQPGVGGVEASHNIAWSEQLIAALDSGRRIVGISGEVMDR